MYLITSGSAVIQAELFDARTIIVSSKPNPTESALRLEVGRLQTELETCKQQPAATFELPEAPDLLNWLKANRRKSTASLVDIEALLGRIEELTPLGGS